VTYRLQNQRFAPGQVKVFTVGTSRKITNPRDLHTGAEFIDLVNGFDPDFPASYYFDIASVSNPQPTDLAKMKIYGSLFVGNTNTPGFMSMQLSIAGQSTPLWRSEYLGQSGNWNVNLTFAFISGLSMTNTTPASWRRLYERTEWNNVSKNSTPRSLSYPLIAMYRGRAEPFTRTINDTYTANAGVNGMSNFSLANFPRAFAVFNIFAPVSDLDLNVEGSRALDTANNSDRFRTNALYRAEISTADGGGWGNVEHFEVKGSDTEGFALLTWLRQDSADSITPGNPLLARKGLSSLPMRQASRADANLLSLGQFQQANLSQLAWQPSFPFANSEASPYVDRARVGGIESYRVGTSTLTGGPALRTLFRPASTLPNGPTNKHLDVSYLLNENLWDSYFLSSIPDSGQLNPETILPNSRHRFIDESNIDESSARDFDLAASQLYNFGSLNVNSTSVEAWKALLTAFRGLAFESEAESRAADEIEQSIPVSRVLDPTSTDLGGGNLKFTFTTDEDGTNPVVDYDEAAIGADTINSGGVTARDFSKFFNGYRHLTDDMIDALARRIVDEVRLRGPFYSLSDFVNRRLVAPDRAYTTNSVWQQARTNNASAATVGLTHSYGVESTFFTDGNGSAHTDSGRIASNYDSFIGLAGINGALQRAINLSGINGGINYPEADNDSGNETDFAFHTTLSPRTLSRTGSGNLPLQIYPSNAHYLDSEHMAGAPTGEVGQLLSHTPGFVTQGDLLAMIGPALTPRGDTFLIRTYGDALNPATGELTGRAWLEAVVQRTIDPVSPAGDNDEDKYRYTDSFGRRFKVISFRWLSESEL
jgi:hypothetical protein